MSEYSTKAIACGLSDVAAWLENESWIPKHVRQIRLGAQRLLDLEARARPLSEWHEEIGDVLWWRFPIEEPPYCGTPNDLGYTVELHTQDSLEPRIACRASIGGWPGYHTHWTRFDVPEEPSRANDERALRENAKRSSPKDASVIGEAEAPNPNPLTQEEADA